MNPIIKITLVKVLKSILAFVSILMVAISGEMATHPTDKTYPVLLIVSLVYLQWVSWDLFFEIIGVPTSDEKRIRSQFKPLFKKVLLDRLILLGYCLILLASVSWYSPTVQEIPNQVMKYGIILIIIGVLARMFAVMRMLIGEKYRNENGA
jgi:hypothetical protein